MWVDMIMATVLRIATSRTAGGSLVFGIWQRWACEIVRRYFKWLLFTDPVRLKVWIQTIYRQLSLPAVLFWRFSPRSLCLQRASARAIRGREKVALSFSYLAHPWNARSRQHFPKVLSPTASRVQKRYLPRIAVCYTPHRLSLIHI